MTQFDQAENEDINATRRFRPCPDSAGFCVPPFGVREVNGPDSVEVLNFAPTRYELIQLVKRWATIVLDYQFFVFLYQTTSSSGCRREAFAGLRINRIATVLGDEAVEKAINEAEEEFSKTVSPRDWSIFKNGTGEEWQALRDEVADALRSWNQKGEEQKGADGR